MISPIYSHHMRSDSVYHSNFLHCFSLWPYWIFRSVWHASHVCIYYNGALECHFTPLAFAYVAVAVAAATASAA